MKSKYVLFAMAALCSGVAQAAWVKAGSAPFDLALETIVPQPYKIELRAAVPSSTVLSWPEGNNWMDVLRIAINPLGLDARHDLSRNVVIVSVANRMRLASASSRDGGVVRAVLSEKSAMDQSNVSRNQQELAIGQWKLNEGIPIHVQLSDWARQAGWSFSWRPERTWVVPADASFYGSFEQAITAVIQTLFDQGKGVRLVLWEGNKFAEVTDVNVK